MEGAKNSLAYGSSEARRTQEAAREKTIDPDGADGNSSSLPRTSQRSAAIEPSETMAFDLRCQHALVVGGYGAIGIAIARQLHSLGASIIIAGRDEHRAHAAAVSVCQDGDTSIGTFLDAANENSIERVLEDARANNRAISIVVNCVAKQIEEPLLSTPSSSFLEVHHSILLPALLLTQCVARHQIANGIRGKHIHLLSLRAFFGVRERGYVSFASAKAAHLNLLRQSALELAQHGIRVNGVAPGVVLTDKNRERFNDPDEYTRVCNQIPLRRLARPNDVGGAVAFLASELSSFVTGQVLFVDGGQTIHQQ